MNSKDYSNSVKLDNPVLAAGLIAGLLYLFLAFVGNGLVANPEVVSKDKALVYFKLVKDGAVWFSLAFGLRYGLVQIGIYFKFMFHFIP